MPDRSDVEQSLAQLVAGILYPNGSGTDSITGDTYRIYRGWPVAGALEADVAQGICHVNVLPVTGSVRETTRYPAEWQGSSPAATLSGSVAGNAVIFSGVGGTGQVAGVLVDGIAYAYRSQPGDSAALVSAALAAQIRANRPAVASGSSLQLLNARGLAVRVVADGQGGTELRRQVAGFRVVFWCSSPDLRDTVVSQVDTAMAGSTFIDVNGWACRLRGSGDSNSDEGAAAGIWRRELQYTIEYPTVANETLPAMLFGIADVNGVAFVG